MYSPWGKVQVIEQIAEGITRVYTAGHGGFKLDRRRQRMMPEYMRQRGGWYEEDCHFAAVVLIWPQHFSGDTFRLAKRLLRDYQPEAYELFFKVKLVAGESYAKDAKDFARVHQNDWLGISAAGDWKKNVPRGYILIVAERQGERKNFFVPVEDYDQRSQFGFVVDPRKHVETDLK